MDTASHFTLVHHQLVQAAAAALFVVALCHPTRAPLASQVRAAFLLAKRLGRLLILPTFVCGLDRFWAPHNGTIPGSDTTLPIDPCPADHVLARDDLHPRTFAPPPTATHSPTHRVARFATPGD